MKKQQNTNLITAIYCRLSKDDLLKGDSMSIQNQRDLLTRYAKDNGFGNIRYFADDGYTGTNFNRPAFQEMLAEIENGNVGTVIVKDLSRFGREYLMTGYYTEMVLPEYNVRFIAVSDGVDSEEGYNDFAPFKNIINEWYHSFPKLHFTHPNINPYPPCKKHQNIRALRIFRCFLIIR